MSKPSGSRLFLDSNVSTKGIIAPMTLDHAMLKLCAARVHQLILAEVVKAEVENNLLKIFTKAGVPSDKLLSDYDQFLKQTDPEIMPAPTKDEVRAARHLIRHEADVPVLLSAIKSHPDWLITNNLKHF